MHKNIYLIAAAALFNASLAGAVSAPLLSGLSVPHLLAGFLAAVDQELPGYDHLYIAVISPLCLNIQATPASPK